MPTEAIEPNQDTVNTNAQVTLYKCELHLRVEPTYLSFTATGWEQFEGANGELISLTIGNEDERRLGYINPADVIAFITTPIVKVPA